MLNEDSNIWPLPYAGEDSGGGSIHQLHYGYLLDRFTTFGAENAEAIELRKRRVCFHTAPSFKYGQAIIAF
jgi:hypothetical protein